MSNLAFAKFNANGVVFTHLKTDLRATSNTCIIDFSLSYSDTTQSNINQQEVNQDKLHQQQQPEDFSHH